ncbi:hypothetical protein GCM10010988_39050 [Cnuibacter physcomitrellae]|nr:HAD family hydrolase [Cnuibacter physcomitrellae]GGI42442.1 hypothetical protein GCM10010988_39050 [Cnuibacter physcomitrellae]
MADPVPARLLVVDLDDTLWYWFEPWYASFRALLGGLAGQSGLAEHELLPEIRQIHQKRGTSEYSWLVDELEVLRPAVPEGMTAREYFDPALHAQNSARLVHTGLREGVRESLESIRTAGTKIVAYTESLEFWTRWRILRTETDGLLDAYYSSPDHDAPLGLDPSALRRFSDDSYQLQVTEHRHVARGVLKPSSEVLSQIIADYGVSPEETVYVGDTLMKDIEMAQRVGVHDVWAKYGVNHADPRYGLLQSVSHWTDEMVRKEQDERPGVNPTATWVLERGFDELLGMFDFRPTRRSDASQG